MSKVLVIDDDPLMLRLCRLVLGIEGHTLSVAENGHQALEVMRFDCPDVIVLDLEMPVMNGRSFFRKIAPMRKRPAVIILSGQDTRAAQEELGAEAAIRKPFDPELLVETVRGLAA